jgi:Zn-dependent protease
VTGDVLIDRLRLLVPLLLSLTVHEFAHAWSAWKLGDDTAEKAGRLTLNPIPHIDLLGTIILPLLGIPFGWAKPVPIDPSRFRRSMKMSTGTMITAAAGPISNVILAVLCALCLGLALRFAPHLVDAGTPGRDLLVLGIQINVALAIFNMLPVPPLDGSRVVEGLLPMRMRGAWETFTRFSPFVLLGVIFFGGAIMAAPRSAALSLLGALIDAVRT